MKNNQKIMVSGIQPSNMLTLGNYLGAIKNYVKLQDQYKMYIFIADLHAITNTFDPKKLLNDRKNVAAFYYACGVDFDKNIVFYQSDVISHTELSHIIICHTTLGELNRMTQFKDKTIKNANNTETIPTGLLIYPALMAADILLYDSDVVIVGKDQKQHLELTRDVANKMNKKYGQMFTVPEPIINENSAKIMDLIDPTIKMSKSNQNGKGIIYLLDDIQQVRNKIAKAVTDSFNSVKFDVKNQPGISNLIVIYSAIKNITIQETEKQFANIENYGQFKKEVAGVVCELLTSIQEKYKYAIDNFDKIEEKLNKNAKICNKIGNEKINFVYSKIGLRG